jgi:hypothetical protein
VKLDRFLADRQHDWARLSTLLDAAEERPDHEVRPEALQDIVRLYREVCSDLNQVRSLTADPEILDRLNTLAGRGYRFVYRRQPRGVTRSAIARFFRREVPRTFRREVLYVIAAAAALLLGAFTGAAAVLVDAPCSGLGALGRRPDARWRVTAADIDRLTVLQRDLLASASTLLRPGGLLVYAVCTLTAAETIAVDGWLGATRPELEPVRPVGDMWRRWGRGGLVLPQDAGTDGMAVFRYRLAG